MGYRASRDPEEQRFDQDFLGYIQAVMASAGTSDKYGHVLQEVRSRVGFVPIEKVHEAEYVTEDTGLTPWARSYTWEGNDYRDSPISKFVLKFYAGDPASKQIRFDLTQK